MNDLIEIPEDQEEAPKEVLHVFMHDGSKFPVARPSFQHRASPEDLILFLKPDGTPDEKIFLRARSVECIVPESALGKSRSFMELQDRVGSIEARLSLVESAVARQSQSSEDAP
jgi:hypothetical protein